MVKNVGLALCDSLKAVYGKNETAKALLDTFAMRKRDVAETTVHRAAQLAGVDYNEMLRALREIAEAGAGEFKVGRKGAKSRIEWEYGVRSLAAAARGEGRPVKLDREELDDIEEVETVEDSEEEGDVVHEFLLRPGKKVRFVLPSDLTQREAERLAGFVQSLPFEAGF